MIRILDLGLGNVGSVLSMVNKIGETAEITNNKNEVIIADKIILPGVGSYDQAIKNLHNLDLIDTLKDFAKSGKPLLGICLGMQILGNSSEEGSMDGLGLIEGEVIKFKNNTELKVPHIGWNQVRVKGKCDLYNGFEEFDETRFYFVHSYHFICKDENNISGTTIYGNEFSSSIQKNRIMGVQFHPEKSHKYGMKLLTNFCKL